jgi:hypothetical protein
MKKPERLTMLHLALGAALIAGTAGGPAALAGGGGGFTQIGPKASHVEPIAGTDIKRVTITLKAAQRLDLKTGQIREKGGVKTAPYAAVIYDKVGKTFVYTNPKPLTYIRHPITIKKYNEDTVVLTQGPAVGTVVATQGVLEIYGTETGL